MPLAPGLQEDLDLNKYMRRPSATPENYLILAAVTWVSVSFLGMIATDAGVYGGQRIIEALGFVVLMVIFPDEQSGAWSWTRVLFSLIIVVGFVSGWVIAYALPYVAGFVFPVPVELRLRDVVAGFLATGLIAPLFEEKLTRHLALRGTMGVLHPAITRYISPGLAASLIVSTIFALAHPKLIIFSFVFSLILCLLCLKYQFGLLQRVFVHGLYNSTVMAWYLTHGFGFFR